MSGGRRQTALFLLSLCHRQPRSLRSLAVNTQLQKVSTLISCCNQRVVKVPSEIDAALANVLERRGSQTTVVHQRLPALADQAVRNDALKSSHGAHLLSQASRIPSFAAALASPPMLSCYGDASPRPAAPRTNLQGCSSHLAWPLSSNTRGIYAHHRMSHGRQPQPHAASSKRAYSNSPSDSTTGSDASTSTSGRFNSFEHLTDMTTPASWYPRARAVRRRLIAHMGPTNSGKTHEALTALKAAPSGVYCGPLRLLACEVREEGDLCGMA